MSRRWSILLLVQIACSPAPAPPFAPCPIRERNCRVDTFLALEAERGQLWDPWTEPPPVSLIDVNELDRRLRLVGWPASVLNWANPLHDLGLLGPEMSIPEAELRWQLDNTGSIYWSHDKEVSIVDRGLPLDDPAATATLTREYTHAAQDREFGMLVDQVSVATTERELVRQTLLEGEADLYQHLAQLRMEGPDPATFDWSAHYTGRLASWREQTLVVDSPHTLVLFALPAPAGGLLMSRAWQQGRSTAVNQILLSPPPSFVSIMLALEGRPGPEPPPRLCSPALVPRDRFEFLGTDRLGAALFYAYLARAFGGESDAWQAALTWRNDQIWSLQALSGGAPVTFWRVHTAGLRDTALGGMLAARTEPPVLMGDDVLFWSGIDQPAADSLRQTITCDR